MLVHNLLFYSVVFASPKMLFVEITICRATEWQLNLSVRVRRYADEGSDVTAGIPP